ncbi:MAG: winged helix-turn-helix transcriptional regulator [Anaerolineales bacterium]|nr:winged helix-turn-helix transcriptional regulator [Anaerolineales bacterium]
MYKTFSALAEPNRLRIVELLSERPQPVGEIAARLRLRQPQVSKHLRVLAEAGLVDRRPAAQQRLYYLQAEPLRQLESWLQRLRPSWGERLDVLDALLNEIQAKPKDKP